MMVSGVKKLSVCSPVDLDLKKNSEYHYKTVHLCGIAVTFLMCALSLLILCKSQGGGYIFFQCPQKEPHTKRAKKCKELHIFL